MIPYEHLTIEQLKSELIKILQPHDVFKDYIQIIIDDDKNLKFYIYTEEHIYYIVAKRDGDCNYLRCSYSCRKSLPGETHFRGDDLSDGPLAMEIFHNILRDIIRTEMCKLSDFALQKQGREIIFSED